MELMTIMQLLNFEKSQKIIEKEFIIFHTFIIC